jgi:O-antigen/teichoic acid export membrane protein
MSADASHASKTVTGAIWLILWRLMTRLIGLMSTLILARLLVPADFGLIAMASTFAGAIDALSQLGLQDALVRRQSDDKEIYNTAFTLQVGRALATSFILAASAPVVAWWFAEPRLITLIMVLAAASAISGFENIGIAEFRRNMQFDVQFRLQLIPRLLQVCVTVVAAILLQNYWALLLGIIVSKTARTVMTYWVHPFRPKLRLAGWQELASFSFWTWATSLASLVWDRCDPFVLGPTIGPARLGLYLLAAEIAVLPVSELLAPVGDALFAGFSSAQKNGGSSLHHAPHVAALMLFGMAPITIIISCASGDIVTVMLGPKWQEAQPLIAIFSCLCLFAPFSWISSMVMFANARMRAAFACNVIASVIKLVVLITVLNITQRLDIIGAAGVFCVALEALVFVLVLKSLADIRLREIAGSVLRTLTATALTVATLVKFGLGWSFIEQSPFSALLDGIIIGAVTIVIYGAAIFVMWQISGRPEGAETRLISILRERVLVIRARRIRVTNKSSV